MQVLDELVQQRKSIDIQKVNTMGNGRGPAVEEKKKMNQVRQSIEMQMSQILNDVKPPEDHGYGKQEANVLRQSMEILQKNQPGSQSKSDVKRKML